MQLSNSSHRIISILAVSCFLQHVLHATEIGFSWMNKTKLSNPRSASWNAKFNANPMEYCFMAENKMIHFAGKSVSLHIQTKTFQLDKSFQLKNTQNIWTYTYACFISIYRYEFFGLAGPFKLFELGECWKSDLQIWNLLICESLRFFDLLLIFIFKEKNVSSKFIPPQSMASIWWSNMSVQNKWNQCICFRCKHNRICRCLCLFIHCSAFICGHFFYFLLQTFLFVLWFFFCR